MTRLWVFLRNLSRGCLELELGIDEGYVLFLWPAKSHSKPLGGLQVSQWFTWQSEKAPGAGDPVVWQFLLNTNTPSWREASLYWGRQQLISLSEFLKLRRFTKPLGPKYCGGRSDSLVHGGVCKSCRGLGMQLSWDVAHARVGFFCYAATFEPCHEWPLTYTPVRNHSKLKSSPCSTSLRWFRCSGIGVDLWVFIKCPKEKSHNRSWAESSQRCHHSLTSWHIISRSHLSRKFKWVWVLGSKVWPISGTPAALKGLGSHVLVWLVSENGCCPEPLAQRLHLLP